MHCALHCALHCERGLQDVSDIVCGCSVYCQYGQLTMWMDCICAGGCTTEPITLIAAGDCCCLGLCSEGRRRYGLEDVVGKNIARLQLFQNVARLQLFRIFPPEVGEEDMCNAAALFSGFLTFP